MNNAKLSKSDRLKRVLKVLKRGGAYSTRDLIRKAKVCAVNSCISEIRANGKRVGCFRRGNIWYYQLEGRLA